MKIEPIFVAISLALAGCGGNVYTDAYGVDPLQIEDTPGKLRAAEIREGLLEKPDGFKENGFCNASQRERLRERESGGTHYADFNYTYTISTTRTCSKVLE